MNDHATEYADKIIREIGSQDYVLREVLAAAFRAGEAYGAASANRKEQLTCPQEHYERGLNG